MYLAKDEKTIFSVYMPAKPLWMGPVLMVLGFMFSVLMGLMLISSVLKGHDYKKDLPDTNRIHKTHKKELPARPVGLRLHGLEALSLSLLETAGTTADKTWKERKL